MANREQDGHPFIDLDPSEWSRDKPLDQPFFTPQGRIFLKHFAFLFALGAALSVPVSIFVYGRAPIWAREWIPFEWRGLTANQSFAFAVLIIGVPLSILAIRWLLRHLRG